VRVRSDEHIVAEANRMSGAPAHKCVLHDHAARPDLYAPILGGHDRAEQHARLRAQAHVAA
jgi:hypothetical protein